MTPKVSLQSHSNTHNRWKPAYSYQRWSGHQISVDTVTAVFQCGPSGQTNLDCFLETTELWLVIRYLQISFYKTQVFGCPPQIWVDQGRIDYWIKKTRMFFSRSIYWNAYISDCSQDKTKDILTDKSEEEKNAWTHPGVWMSAQSWVDQGIGY